MQRVNLYRLLSHITTGVAVFIAASGAMWAFFTYYHFSLLGALAAAVIGMVPGLLMLLVSEGLFVLLSILEEKQEQTRLLRSIEQKLTPRTEEPPPASDG